MTPIEPMDKASYLAAQYPSYFIDDPANRLPPHDPRSLLVPPAQVTAALCKLKDPNQPHGLPMQPSNAVDSIRDLFAGYQAAVAAATDLPQWNLDADRGMYFWTWQFTNGIYDPTAIEEAP
jgi:hypothetical protein